MAIESKNHRPSHVENVTVSEGSRRDARPVNGLRFETYREEREHWIQLCKRIDSELTAYSNAAFAGEQARIRRENAEDKKASFRKWISLKASMEAKRQNLLRRKREAEEEIMRLKPLVKQENIRMATASKEKGPGSLYGFEMFREDGTLSWDAVAAEMILQLRAIRKLLEESNVR